MKIKGYVVRGLKRGGDARIATGLCLTADDACSEAVIFREDGHTDVRILAVAEDGTETPLRTYEEALAEIAASETAKALAASELAELERLRALLAKVFGGEAGEASLGQLVELAAVELAEIDDAVREHGFEARGPDDTLPARVGRLIEDANEVERGADAADDILERIVAAWRDDEIGQLDGALVEEAEALLGITPEADPLAAEPTS